MAVREKECLFFRTIISAKERQKCGLDQHLQKTAQPDEGEVETSLE